MTEEQDVLLTELTRHLKAAHANREALVYARLVTSRAMLRLANAGRLELTLEQEDRMDTLYGLVRWGLLVFPLMRIRPEVFAAERRERRARPAVVRDWRD